jgi:hypothetical protein
MSYLYVRWNSSECGSLADSDEVLRESRPKDILANTAACGVCCASWFRRRNFKPKVAGMGQHHP